MAEKQLSKEELQKYQKELDEALKKSNEHIKDFKVYIGVYRSSFKAQTSHLTQEEYEMLQDKIKCYKVKSLNTFYDGLSQDDNYVTHKAIVLDENNFAMAFHPMVWKVLTFEERISAMRIAWQKTNGKEVKEFCNHVTTTVAFVGKDYQGALNIGAMLAYDDAEGPWNLLKYIANANNSIKFNYYFNKMRSKDYKYITDFECFEELQYIAPLEPNTENVEEMQPKVKAIFFNQLERRRDRQNYLNADYLLLDHSEDLKGMFLVFDECLEREIQDILKTDELVDKELGYFQKDIDEDFLSFKVQVFNNTTIDEHNKLVEEYQKYDAKIKEIKKPALEATKDLRAKRDKLKKDLESAGDAIEIGMINDQIYELNKEINKTYKKMLKKDRKLLEVLTEKRETIYKQIQELASHIITLEDAKEHFKEHFYPAKAQEKSASEFTGVDTIKMLDDDYEKMN